MKKLLLFITGLLLLFSVEGQILRYSNYAATTPPEEEPEVENMLSNGTFTNSDDWTTDAPWSIGSGVASFNNTGSGGLKQAEADMVTAIEVETDYRLTFTLAVDGGGSHGTNLRIDNSALAVTYSAQSTYTSGTITIDFTTPSDIGVGGFAIRGSSTSPYACTVDNVVLSLR